MSVRDRVVIITGATSTLGQVLLPAFMNAGARLALVVRRKESVDRLRRSLGEQYQDSFVSSCDIRYEEDVVRLIHRVGRHFGRIDSLVNVASTLGLMRSIEEYPVDAWRNVFATNVTGAFLLCREVLPWMKRQHSGNIIHITRKLPSGVIPTFGAYHVSQDALDGLVRRIASENKTFGVKTNLLDIGPPKLEQSPVEDYQHFTETMLWLAGEDCGYSGRRVQPATRPNGTISTQSTEAERT